MKLYTYSEINDDHQDIQFFHATSIDEATMLLNKLFDMAVEFQASWKRLNALHSRAYRLLELAQNKWDQQNPHGRFIKSQPHPDGTLRPNDAIDFIPKHQYDEYARHNKIYHERWIMNGINVEDYTKEEFIANGIAGLTVCNTNEIITR